MFLVASQPAPYARHKCARICCAWQARPVHDLTCGCRIHRRVPPDSRHQHTLAGEGLRPGESAVMVSGVDCMVPIDEQRPRYYNHVTALQVLYVAGASLSADRIIVATEVSATHSHAQAIRSVRYCSSALIIATWRCRKTMCCPSTRQPAAWSGTKPYGHQSLRRRCRAATSRLCRCSSRPCYHGAAAGVLPCLGSSRMPCLTTSGKCILPQVRMRLIRTVLSRANGLLLFPGYHRDARRRPDRPQDDLRGGSHHDRRRHHQTVCRVAE